MARILTVEGVTPSVAAARYVAPDAVLAGDVELGQDATVWFGVVARAEYAPVRIGARTNVQDGSILHADPGRPCVVGDDVTIGHRAVVHGCTLEDGVLVGMGAVVLNGAVVGRGSLVAAGAVVREEQVVPPDSLVAGVPATVRSHLGEGRETYGNVASYLELGELYAALDEGTDPTGASPDDESGDAADPFARPGGGGQGGGKGGGQGGGRGGGEGVGMNVAELAAGLPATPGYRYAELVGDRLLVAGQVPHDGEGRLVGAGDVVAQTGACLDNLRSVLAVQGCTVADVRQVTVHVVGDRAALGAAWGAVLDWFDGPVPPATLLGVPVLGHDGQLVEVDATVLRDP